MYEWTSMPFGLRMLVLKYSLKPWMKSLTWSWNQFVKVFVDDVNEHSRGREVLLEHIWHVFSNLEVNLKLNPIKSELETNNLVFMGHMVDASGVRLDLGKFKTSIKLCRTPNP